MSRVRKQPKRRAVVKANSRRFGLLRYESLEVRQVLSGSPLNAPPYPVEDTFNLQSLPSATKTIYLDFTGHTTTDTGWNDRTGGAPIVTPAFSMDDDFDNFSEAEHERIQYIWERVREDFAPFNVNVTTKDPGVESLRKAGANDTRWGIRVVIGGADEDWYQGDAGGVAYYNSFNWDSDTPCFVFSETLGNGEKNNAEAISHEVGHSLGLAHDGETTGVEYYGGHGNGDTGWAPIMGVGYSKNLSQWSKGEYPDANNNQDDLNIITTKNGFDYRVDDFGNDRASATPIVLGTTVTMTGGIIERNTDVDYFYFSVIDTSVVLNIDPFYRGPNLDILASIYDVDGNLVATSNPADGISANFNVILTSGIYYLSVEGTGKPAEGNNPGYSDYGSLGNYTISGSATYVDLVKPTVTSIAAPTLETAGGISYTFDVTYADNVALDNATIGNGDVIVTGPNGFSTVATFVSINDNTIGTPRTATYRISAPGGAWNWFDTGLYTVTVPAAEIKDTGGNSIDETIAGTFVVNIAITDTVAPTIVVDAPLEGQVFTTGVITVSGSAEDVGGANIGFIRYTVNGTIQDVQYPAGLPSTPFSFNGVTLVDGTNTIVVQVFDRAGNDSIPVTVSVIYVEFDKDAPEIEVDSLTAEDVHVGGPTSYSFTIRYKDLVGLDVSRFDSNDVRVTGPNGFSRLATFVSVDVNSDGTPRTVTYRFTTPGGTWDISDNGIYTVTIRAGQVSDTSDNYMPETVAGTFDVAILEALPLIPSNVSATDGTFSDKVRVTWNASATASGYEVWRSTTNNSATAIKLADVVNPTYDDVTATPNVNYWYFLKAKNSGGTTVFSQSDAGRAAIIQTISNGPTQVIALGASAGQPTTRVKVVHAETGAVLAKFTPYGNSFRGGVSVAVADLNGDGEAEIIVAPGPGADPIVKVFNISGGEMGNYRFRAYDSSFKGGVYVATGDVNGDGRIDIITTPGAGSAAEVKVWKNRFGIASSNPDPIANNPLMTFLAFGSSFKGGATVAAGDITGDGKADIVVGNGPGMSPTVRVFDTTLFNTTGLAPHWNQIKPFNSGDRGGVFVAVGNVRGDFTPEIILGNGENGRGRVEMYNADGSRFKSFNAFDDSTKNAPVHVAVKDIDHNDGGLLEIVTSQGEGGNRHRKYWQPDATLIDEVFEDDLDFNGKYFVA